MLINLPTHRCEITLNHECGSTGKGKRQLVILLRDVVDAINTVFLNNPQNAAFLVDTNQHCWWRRR